MKMAGFILILLGVVALIYGGFTYTTHKNAVDMGPLQIRTAQHHEVFFPPILGIAGLVVGGAMVFFGARGGR